VKYKVGDVLFMKNCDYKPPLRPVLRPPLRLLPHLRLENTYGIITEAYKYSDMFEGDSTEDDNVYIWYSQVDAKEYYFYENEVEGEVIK